MTGSPWADAWAGEPRALRTGHFDREDLLVRLGEARVALNAFAALLLADTVPVRAGAPVDVVVTVRTVAGLGLGQGGTLAQVHDALPSDLAPCPVDLGPYLRLAHAHQPDAPDSLLSAGRPPTAALHVLGPRLSEDPAYPRGYYLRTVEGVPWLRGFRCDDQYVLPGDHALVLARVDAA